MLKGFLVCAADHDADGLLAVLTHTTCCAADLDIVVGERQADEADNRSGGPLSFHKADVYIKGM